VVFLLKEMYKTYNTNMGTIEIDLHPITWENNQEKSLYNLEKKDVSMEERLDKMGAKGNICS